jgi:outer membrane protein TolC
MSESILKFMVKIRWSFPLLLLLASCASYTPKSLPVMPDSKSSVSSLVRPHRHRFDPRDGLDGEELAMLAVANNPELRAARARLRVAHAQVFAAGLLADPQLGASEDFTMTPNTQNAWALGLGFDVGDWLLRSSRRQMARAGQSQVQQEMLWQEWQVVAQARFLYARLQTYVATTRILKQETDWLQQVAQASHIALSGYDVTAEMANGDLLALRTVQQQQQDEVRLSRQDMGKLQTLLGLDTSANIQLQDAPVPVPLDVSMLRQQVTQRLYHRPDLAAIRAAYQTSEAGYHAAVLAQFPLLSVGINRAQDNYGDNSVGPGITLSLPLFNRNRGNIAIARASRAQLSAEYQARLDAASNQALLALDNYDLLSRQIGQVKQDLPPLQAQVASASEAYAQGNLTVVDMTRLEMVLCKRQLTVVRLNLALEEQRIALQTLLGAGLPDEVMK